MHMIQLLWQSVIYDGQDTCLSHSIFCPPCNVYVSCDNNMNFTGFIPFLAQRWQLLQHLEHIYSKTDVSFLSSFSTDTAYTISANTHCGTKLITKQLLLENNIKYLG